MSNIRSVQAAVSLIQQSAQVLETVLNNLPANSPARAEARAVLEQSLLLRNLTSSLQLTLQGIQPPPPKKFGRWTRA